jgi:hypothetical protein
MSDYATSNGADGLDRGDNNEFEVSTGTISTLSSTPTPTDTISPAALTPEEAKDVNAIQVEITDQIPTVVLYGAASSGKTMALIRLARYLRTRGYTVEPVFNFRPGNEFYQNCCRQFNDLINKDIASDSTNIVSFLLLLVKCNGKKICQVLEAPGEHFFNKDQPEADYPAYIHRIINLPHPKIWTFFIEKNWETQSIRDSYSSKIVKLFGRIKHRDHVVLLYNKADQCTDYLKNDEPIRSLFLKDAMEQYSVLFSRIVLGGIIERILKSNSRAADFEPFSSGTFTTSRNNTKQFIQSIDYYPRHLWQAIEGGIKGKWF